MQTRGARNAAFWARFRDQLDGRGGRQFWRCLDELIETEAFRSHLVSEFPAIAPLMTAANRRDVLRVMGASLALAGLSGCDVAPPQEAALPYVEAPQFMVPGEPRYYATATTFEGYAVPVLVETHMARPIKVEGNPEHPVSRGRTDAFAQAAVLDLYDPGRSQAVTYYGQLSSWNACQLALVELAARLAHRRGRGLALLSGAITSPTVVRQIRQLRDRFPEMSWFIHEPVGSERRYAAARLAFGQPLDLHLRLDRADVIVSLDADFLGPGPHQVPYARQWIEGRRIRLAGGDLARLHVLESTPSLTGAKATRLIVASSPGIANFTLALAQAFGVAGTTTPDLPLPLRAHLQVLVEELRRAERNALVLAGRHLPSEFQALALAVNDRLGSIGQTLSFADPIEAHADVEDRSLAALAGAIDAGEVENLVILDSNPVYTAPADLDFASLLERVALRVHLGPFRDETAALCHWHVPLAHPFESWSDARAVDGTATIIQPLLRPLFGGRTMHELLATLAVEPQLSSYDLVRATWRERLAEEDFETAWTKVLQAGFVEGSAAELRAPSIGAVPAPEPQPPIDLEAVIRPDPSVWDGRYFNNAWLQELPKPFNKVTWDNVAEISPRLAAEWQVAEGDLIQISVGERQLVAPVWILPGQAERTITLYLGYGRGPFGQVGGGLGYDAYRLRTTAEPWTLRDVTARPTGGHALLASTQEQQTLAGHHDLIREITPAELVAGRAVEPDEALPSLYPKWEYPDYAWAMAIDIDACIGCNACVLACVAENNIPVVGKEQVARGREMHWLKIDRYYTGPLEQPETHWQPRPCMHCEKAPCEVGCPVNATVHGPEGLNQMIYNRCVGTRTCASYCPYKVRRFNYLDFTDAEAPSTYARRNPDVTVRARGVMEKCTYCVQRIRRAHIEADMTGRPIPDGRVETACQQVCPTRAIIFGDRNDPESAVSIAKGSPRNYTLLRELNTRPRTTYLAEVRLPGSAPEAEES
jgi:molybdopterin-containing oxidoreductase family iron-sulfur binding subunit